MVTLGDGRPWAGDLLILGQDIGGQTKWIQTLAICHQDEFLFITRKLQLLYPGPLGSYLL